MNEIKLPPLPEWSKMDNLNGLVPSEIRQRLTEYARAAIVADRQARGEPIGECHPNVLVYGIGIRAMIYPVGYYQDDLGVKIYTTPQIPDHAPIRESMSSNHRSYAEGWNACRGVMIESTRSMTNKIPPPPTPPVGPKPREVTYSLFKPNHLAEPTDEIDNNLPSHARSRAGGEEMKPEQPKSQAQRIREIGLSKWLDEPMDLDEFYGKPSDKPSIFKKIYTYFRRKYERVL